MKSPLDLASITPSHYRCALPPNACDRSLRTTRPTMRSGCAAGNRTEVIDFHLSRHGGFAESANRFAHGFIEECGDDAAVQVARGAVKCSRIQGRGNDRTVGRARRIRVAARTDLPGRNRNNDYWQNEERA